MLNHINLHLVNENLNTLGLINTFVSLFPTSSFRLAAWKSNELVYHVITEETPAEFVRIFHELQKEYFLSKSYLVV